MTQSNLNQAGLELSAKAAYEMWMRDWNAKDGYTPYDEPWEDYSNPEYFRDVAKAAIAAYLECVEQYDAELLVDAVSGLIYNDKAERFDDEECIRTSSVVSGFIQTRNTRYKIINKPPTTGDSR